MNVFELVALCPATDPYRYYDEWGNAYLFDSHLAAEWFRRMKTMSILLSFGGR
jgi:hypothetical protein